MGNRLPAGVATLIFALGCYGILDFLLTRRFERLMQLVRRGVIDRNRFDEEAFAGKDEMSRLGRAILEMASTLRRTTLEANDQTRQLDELFSAMHRVAASGFTCKSCDSRVTYAAATEVLHMALLEGSDAAVGQSWLDDVIYSVVDRYHNGMSRTSAAQRQRRSRCRRCVMELLQAALATIGVHRD